MRLAGAAARGAGLILALLVCAPAAADLYSGETAYLKGDFAKAFQDFRELAEIGQPTAQLALAIMYGRGEGVRQSDIYAYAWASLAADNGLEKAKAYADELHRRLAPGSEKIATDIRDQFGNARLDSQLNPEILEGAHNDDLARCHPVKTYLSAYPRDARRRGVQGQVYAEFSLMPDGRSRLPRIIYAVPEKLFDAAVRESLLRSEFGSAPAGTPPAQCTIFYNFKLRIDDSDYSRLLHFVAETRSHAEAGDPAKQMLYGILLVGLPQLHEPRSRALPWFLKAAQGGIPSAQYQVGFSLLKGWGCNCDENKGLDWLRRAAQQGQPDAEVTLAMYALKGNPDEQRSRQARLWLEQAAASGSHDGKLYLAALLAAAPAASGGDPKRALALLDEVFRGVNDDPTAFEIRAAAEASSGDFKAASRSEGRALEMAQKLSWDVSPLNERLSAYNSKQPWRGSLLDF